MSSFEARGSFDAGKFQRSREGMFGWEDGCCGVFVVCGFVGDG
jgi:hypothetical protein